MEQLILFQVASHASRTVPPGSGKEKKMSATYGRKCLEQLEKFSRVGLWAKTYSALLIGQEGWSSTRCRLIWKLRGTKYSRFYFQLRPLALPTEGIEFGLLPTPMAQERNTTEQETIERQKKYGGKKRAMYLENFAAMGMLPTPLASEGTKMSGSPTENQMSMTKLVRQKHGKTSQLNPRFVAEMMGFPPNWTELPFLSGELNPLKDTETP